MNEDKFFCTNHLRFVRRNIAQNFGADNLHTQIVVLQQCWLARVEHQNFIEEWRDVPIVDEEKKN